MLDRGRGCCTALSNSSPEAFEGGFALMQWQQDKDWAAGTIAMPLGLLAQVFDPSPAQVRSASPIGHDRSLAGLTGREDDWLTGHWVCEGAVGIVMSDGDACFSDSHGSSITKHAQPRK